LRGLLQRFYFHRRFDASLFSRDWSGKVGRQGAVPGCAGLPLILR
jgi:hypothetical protein